MENFEDYLKVSFMTGTDAKAMKEIETIIKLASANHNTFEKLWKRLLINHNNPVAKCLCMVFFVKGMEAGEIGHWSMSLQYIVDYLNSLEAAEMKLNNPEAASHINQTKVLLVRQFEKKISEMEKKND